MSGQDDDTEKSFDPTPKKLEDARKKGEIARSTDLNTAASYAGLTLAFLLVGATVVQNLGTTLTTLLDQPGTLSKLVFEGDAATPIGGIAKGVGWAVLPIFLLPALAVLMTIAAQNGFVFAPSKLEPKLSKISVISNAKNKFGRSGLFEFAKSFSKLVIFSTCLAFFLKGRLPEIVTSVQLSPGMIVTYLAELCIAFLFVVVVVAGAIGAIDAFWQHSEHIRKNRMSRKDMTDESKESEGDPHLKQERRQRAQAIAMNQMMADVPDADVVIVNPTHYSVALKWSRSSGSAPICVAKGLDEVAARIREVAQSNGVPIRSDPPTARALFAVVDIGVEIPTDLYQSVAAAIRFAEDMRERAKQQV
ncbi:EscU/YscU/HrcU family type III secretion system export apparatus switch protein [Pseudosulfitobacter sp. SM2401]|uniref:flagellar type III secretion system protein FlhB n=1 Tax=Pseudosulfitobacter sp. SM2401 TaxID=3350098 RepID=UPI0036F1F923